MKFIIVAGLIGAGKTRFTEDLSRYLGFEAAYEPVDENPYLSDFYKEPARWGYPMQEHLKSMRFRTHIASVWSIKAGNTKGVVSDRSIWEDTIFAEINRDLGNITEREYQTYLHGFADMSLFLAEPDVLIFLDASPETCKARADGRARPQEMDTSMNEVKGGGIPLSYMQRLSEGYESWLGDISSRMPVVRVGWEEFRPVEEVWEAVQATVSERSRFNRSLRV
jgi:deoxyadenosine kinase